MSGLAGLWNLDGRPVEREILAQMSAALAHRGPDGENIWIDGPVGLACQLMRVTPESAGEVQPLAHPSSAVLVFDGRLDNRDELLAALGPGARVDASSPDPVLVLAAYAAWDEKFCARLLGDFALALYDPRRRHLLLARDAVGVRPLYYCRAGENFLFASEIKALLAHPGVTPRPNDDTLTAQLVSRIYEVDRAQTYFDGIERLLPAHLGILTASGWKTRKYWDYDIRRRIRLRGFAEYAEAFRAEFERAVRRRLRSTAPVAATVSGGVDSSSVFCLAASLRRERAADWPPLIGLCFTSPRGSHSDEDEFVLAVEQRTGATIERFPAGPLQMLQDCEVDCYRSETPALAPLRTAHQRLFQRARDRGARTLLLGEGGDELLFNRDYLIDYFHRLAWLRLRRHLQEFPRWNTEADPRGFRQVFFRELVRYHLRHTAPAFVIPLLRRLRDSLGSRALSRPWYTEEFRRRIRRPQHRGDYRLPPASAHVRGLYELASLPHQAGFFEWYNIVASYNQVEVLFPFLDRELIAFLMALPGGVHCQAGVPKAILREALRDLLPGTVAERRWKADFTHLVNAAFRREFADIQRRLLSDGPAVRLGYVDPDRLRSELSRLEVEFQGNTGLAAKLTLDLLGLDAWLRTFMDVSKRSTWTHAHPQEQAV